MRLLQLKPQVRQNWTALAVAHHLQGDPARAVEILSSFENTLKVHKERISNANEGRSSTRRLRTF